MYLKEENLKATTNGQVVKIGDTVHRKVKGGPILHLIHETPTSISGGSLYLLRWG